MCIFIHSSKMSKFLSFLPHVHSFTRHTVKRIHCRTFLSEAYQCNEAWESRLKSPILQKVNLDELYHNLDQRYQKSKQISAVDVDIFANAINDAIFIDELLDLVHKLRLSVDTGCALDSMGHAVIRSLVKSKRFDELLNVLDDRLNYGIFLDYYTGNLLLDLFWKQKNYAAGARIASQFMLQEDFGHPLISSYSLLHFFNYLKKPENWPVLSPPPEPEEEVKVRVKYLRNPFNDDHFDLRDPMKIVGKSIYYITKLKHDPISKSFTVLGLALHGKTDKAKKVADSCKTQNISLCKEIVGLAPEDNELRNIELLTQNEDVEAHLIEEVKKASKDLANDIESQKKVFAQWEENRVNALQEQWERLGKLKRLEEIEKMKEDLEEKETKLWFFENEEKIELGIEAKKIYYPKRWFGKKKKPRKVDEGYIPPEIQSKHPLNQV